MSGWFAWAAVILSLLLLACTNTGARIARDDASHENDDVAPSDATESDLEDVAYADANFAVDFAAGVRRATADGGTPSTCASPLPTVAASGVDEARTAVRTFIAEVLGVSPADLTMTLGQCAGATGQTCARTFQHDIYKSNGIYGESLYPLAMDLEVRGAFVEETIWVATVDGSISSAVVAISGIVDGVVVGVLMFNDRLICP